MPKSPVVLFHLFHYVLFLSHCSEVLLSGWWTKGFLPLNKCLPSPSLAGREEVGVRGRWMGADVAKEVQDTRGACKGCPHRLRGRSVLQMSQLQPTWAEKLLKEYLNSGPGSLPLRQASMLPTHRLPQQNVPSDTLGSSAGYTLHALHPSSVSAPAQEWLEAARQGG